MSYIGNIEMFERFLRGDFVRCGEELDSNAFWLKPEDMDIGGGRMKLHEIDKLKDYPETEVLTISGLDQECFEYFVKNYGKQFKIIQFFKNKRVEDWSLLSTLSQLEYLYFFFNQRIDRLWNMTENENLKGIALLDFSRLKSLSGIETAKNLEYFCLGNAVWDKCEIDSYRYFANTNVRFLAFRGKRILDRDASYLATMKNLEVVQGVTAEFTKEQLAWVKANSANSLELGPIVSTGFDMKTKEPYAVVLFWKGKRSYKMKNNEQRYARDLAEFNALVERYRGVPYEVAFGEEKEH